ncbi:class I SAM-dependent methyltransferase [Desulfocurvibacter africanus]|uniref:class I SAM-dependent methyltransferase n=1 Tax=Desulfocurvibacter africanus TaxID=873 RepID=UPI00110C5961|nr:methyltransferase domain-containing protein [Desulfocurvibacter africanus]
MLKYLKHVVSQNGLFGFYVESRYGNKVIDSIEQFYKNWQGYRSIEACEEQTGIDSKGCRFIKAYLYQKRRLGNYFFEADSPPQKFMRHAIIAQFPSIGPSSKILEIGPGNYPLFPPEDYPGWYGCDPFFDGEAICFRHHVWAKGRYCRERMRRGSWECLANTYPEKLQSFDLVTGSHSYEHTSRPLTAIRQAMSMLKPGGILAIFIPDGYSNDPSNQDPTHTFYATPELLEEFFSYAGGFENISIRSFRPNADLFVSAIRK